MKNNKRWHNDESVKKEVIIPIFVVFTFAIIAFLFISDISSYLLSHNTSKLLNAIDDFQHVNRIVIHYNSDSIEINDSNYNFNALKAMLNPVSEYSAPLLSIDTSALISYIEIDYFIDSRIIFRANIFKIPDDFTPPETYRFLLNRNKFSIGDSYNRGVVFLNNYNPNFLSHLAPRTSPLGKFEDNEFDIYTILALLQ